ncbi:FMN phosphatase YigB (HAD superfamily) [Bradyrhizobium liaoningense]|nr:hypothetical protein GCM10007858_55200 [Bradyrhizobium liaoningense]
MTPTSDLSAVKALVFDVFGTVVDWRTSLISDFMWPRGSLQIPPGVVSQIPPPARQDKGLLV